MPQTPDAMPDAMTDAEHLTEQGNALAKLQRPLEALACYEQALLSQPDHLEALKNRGNVLRALNFREQALASYAVALQFKPDYSEALNNSGVVLQELDRPEEALTYYERALQHQPVRASTLVNHGVALQNLNRPDAALTSFDEAIRLERGLAEAHFGAALCRLLLGDFIGGWQAYEWRRKIPAYASVVRDFTQPLWLGDTPVRGKTILLYAEQGLGDTLQFCRYARTVAELGATVWLEVQPPLQALLMQLRGVEGIANRTGTAGEAIMGAGIQGVLARGEALPHFDYHCPLPSLPLALRTELATIPARAAYLKADAGKIAAWSQRLAAYPRPWTGVVWSGNVAHVNDRHRSIPLAQLNPVFGAAGSFISLQKEVPEQDRAGFAETGLIDIAAALHDFTDTAAVLACLDHVVTVDTAVAHLAGAMGQSATLLLPFRPDFRWLLERSDSPWYPSLQLVRQRRRGDWSGAIAEVAARLREKR
jgi:tetratricopeptide (TPR) repeat protein